MVFKELEGVDIEVEVHVPQKPRAERQRVVFQRNCPWVSADVEYDGYLVVVWRWLGDVMVPATDRSTFPREDCDCSRSYHMPSFSSMPQEYTWRGNESMQVGKFGAEVLFLSVRTRQREFPDPISHFWRKLSE